jgi:hypothetical protein
MILHVGQIENRRAVGTAGVHHFAMAQYNIILKTNVKLTLRRTYNESQVQSIQELDNRVWQPDSNNHLCQLSQPL